MAAPTELQHDQQSGQGQGQVDNTDMKIEKECTSKFGTKEQ